MSAIRSGYDCPYCGNFILHKQAKRYCSVCERELVETHTLEKSKWRFWLSKSRRNELVCPVCRKADYACWLATCSACGRIAKSNYYGKVPTRIVGPQTTKNLGRTHLSAQEIQYLTQRAESRISSHNYDGALECYNQLIQRSAPHPFHFKRRGFCHRLLGHLETATNDFTKAIELDPDDGTTYWERGATKAQRLSLEKNIPQARKRELLAQVLADYKASVERIPTSTEAWLAILETDLLLHEWDDAISVYGACKQYVDTQSYQLVRAWLGSLALTFAGDELDDECKTPLHDMTTRLKNTEWCVSEIDSLFIELEHENFDRVKLDKAKAMHQKLLDHFDESPIRYEPADR
jgi:tetratricopeptide (TPR) repeat protein